MSTRYFDMTNSFGYNVITADENVLINSTQNSVFDAQTSLHARIVAFEAKQNTVLTGAGNDILVDFSGANNSIVLNGGTDSISLIDSNDANIYAFGSTGEKTISGADSSTKTFIGDQLKYIGCWEFHHEGNNKIGDLIVEVKNPYEGDTTRSTLRFRDVTVNDAPQFIGNGYICSAEPPKGETSEEEEEPTITADTKIDDIMYPDSPHVTPDEQQIQPIERATGSKLVSPGTITDTPSVTPTAENFF